MSAETDRATCPECFQPIRRAHLRGDRRDNPQGDWTCNVCCAAWAARPGAEQARRAADELTAESERLGLYDLEIPPCDCGRAQPCRHCPATTDGEVRRQESPVVRLRRAADLVEQRAAAATAGPWHPEHAYGNPNRVQAVYVECAAEDGCVGVDCIDGTHGIGGYDADGDNRWSILAGPQLAGPLAAWLRFDATLVDTRLRDYYGPTEPRAVVGLIAGLHRHSLALADQILAGEA